MKINISFSVNGFTFTKPAKGHTLTAKKVSDTTVMITKTNEAKQKASYKIKHVDAKSFVKEFKIQMKNKNA